ncbi:bifunctional (p)ppGpp synthetase/guanosine-3',5'-bis(diphosphate) 3'-pyrophosphohydrolase [Candidatus Gracilibacteria bacterium]|nr:bifunctional (p)ppGpp synthetase/guanosine-3',5'-bis(diphosphate) 3'-pyrophosphohydrolase [Candidatus Gracilibacteria bacterium]
MPTSTYKKFFDIHTVVVAAKKHSPLFDSKLFIKAFKFAEKAHRGQMRKDGKTPYIAHPVAVTQILCDMHADQDILISALLHDVPEDTKHGIDEVTELFGEKVGFLVDGITKLSKVHYQRNMPERQIESLKKLFLHSAEDPRVILIKLADRLHNMMTLGNIPQPEKRLRIARETLEIYVPMANLLGIQQLKQKLEDLCFMHIFPSE